MFSKSVCLVGVGSSRAGVHLVAVDFSPSFSLIIFFSEGGKKGFGMPQLGTNILEYSSNRFKNAEC